MGKTKEEKIRGLKEPMLSPLMQRPRLISFDNVPKKPISYTKTMVDRTNEKIEEEGLEAEIGKNGFIDPTTLARGRSNSLRNKMKKKSKSLSLLIN